MNRSRLHGWLSAVCEWIARLAVLNLLWLGLCLLGLVVGGVFPATAAMFTVARRWRLAGDERVAIFGVLWSAYKAELVRANLLGYGLAAVGWLLYLDVRLFADSQPLLVISLIACAAYLLMLLHIWPVFVHLDQPWHQQIRVAAMLGLAHPVRALHLVAVAVGLYLVFFQVPGLIVFFGGSVLATFATWQTMSALERHPHQDQVSGESSSARATTAPSTERLSTSPLR